MIIRTPCEQPACAGTISFAPTKGVDAVIAGICDGCDGWFELSAGTIRTAASPPQRSASRN